MISTFLDRLRQSQFARSVAVLVSGTAIAQAIAMLAAPVLTRLYKPEHFAVFALFSSIVSSLLPAICGRYEVAIVVASSDKQGKLLLGGAVQIALGLSTVVLLGILLFGDFLVAILNASSLGIWFALVPLALFIHGIIEAFVYYSNRVHEYGVITKTKLLQTIVYVITAISLGIIGLGADGLLFSILFSLVITSSWLVPQFRHILDKSLLDWGKEKRKILKYYGDFPIYNASTGLFDGFRASMPVFFLMRYFAESIVGYYSLLLRVAQTPLSFISSAVSQVHLKKVADLVNQNKPVRPYLTKITFILIVIVTPFTVSIIFLAPDLFALIFGENWREAGTLGRILMPSLAVSFVVSTLSTTFGGTENNRLAALWKVIAFIGTAGMFTLLAPRLAINDMLWAMMITDIILYLIYYMLIWQAAGNPKRAR